MQKIIDYFKQYIGVISIVLALCILLTYSLSYFMVNTGNKRAAEMYIGELKYSMTIEGNSTNTLSVPAGETIVDVNITNQNGVDTYFKLLYLKNDNVTISYYDETKNTGEVYTKYLSSGELLEKGITGTLKLKIINNSSSAQTLTFSVSGGYSTNKLTDVDVPSSYSEITTMETTSSNTYFCKTGDTLSQGLKYIDEQYTYSYKQQGSSNSGAALSWANITTNGWGVQLTNKTSTNTVNSKLCTYINNKPTISMTYMFSNSKATSIDVSGFDTSYVIDMNNMFASSQATSISGLSIFNTSNVTNMRYMFNTSKAASLDLSKFNTSKVTNMSSMFKQSSATTINVSSFNTAKVTDMHNMFSGSQATTISGLKSFNTSKVTNMNSMFYSSQATTLDISGFNTTKVTDMGFMFQESKAKTLNVSKFNTSNVTNMSYMFSSTQVTTLDLSNFNTSKVTSMEGMFWNSKVTTINGLNKFNTSKVTTMKVMFKNTGLTALDLSSFDTSNVTNMEGMFNPCASLTTLNLGSFNTSKVTNMSYMFNGSTSLKTIYVSDKFVTTAVTSSTSMFGNMPKLVGGNGTKYNSSHVDKTYARIDKSGTPGYFTKVPSFSDDSWATIVANIKAGKSSEYKVGNTKTVNLGTTYGTHTLRVANTTTPSECSTSGFSQTACGFVVEFADIITTHNMNSSNTNVGGWPATSMRTFVNTNIYNALPSDLRNVIIDTTVISSHGSTSGEENFTSTDKLYLLAPKEIYTDWSRSWDSAKDLTRTLDYYTNIRVTTSSYSGAIKYKGTSADNWWLRGARSTINATFFYIKSDGDWGSTYANSVYGVSPAFRLG